MNSVKEEVKRSMCRRCVNYLEFSKDCVECDYDYFERTSKEKAELYMPVLFDCLNFEDIEEI